MKVKKFSVKQLSIILGDLWENAIFDKDLLSLFEELPGIVDQENTQKITHKIISEPLLTALSTNRNRQVITSEQQQKLQNTVVVFYGLSVGGNAATSWVMESRAKTILISDPDEVSPTNLNRLPIGWNEIGKKKIAVIARRLREINPYISIEKSTEKDIYGIITRTKNKPDIIVDAIDDMQSKIQLRKLAKNLKIPLVSAADVGDNVTLDIERYDRKPYPEMFLGRVVGIEKIDFSKLSEVEKRKLIIKLVGYENHSEAMLYSLSQIGKTATTWPQLGSTAQIAGGIVATVIKKIVLGENIESGRFYFSLDEILLKDYNNKIRENERENLILKVERKILNEE